MIPVKKYLSLEEQNTQNSAIFEILPEFPTMKILKTDYEFHTLIFFSC